MATSTLNLAVAACNNLGIGFEGRIPWTLKRDLAFFKTITSTTRDPNKQNAVVMGRKTWFSIPEKVRPLPQRINIVLSRTLLEAPKGAHLAHSFPDALALLSTGSLSSKVESVFVIGGSLVYKEAMMSDRFPCRIYFTRVFGDFECDTFIPSPDDYGFQKVPNPEGIPSETLTENDIDFKFEVYEKNMEK